MAELHEYLGRLAGGPHIEVVGSTHTEAPDSTVSEIALKPIQQPE